MKYTLAKPCFFVIRDSAYRPCVPFAHGNRQCDDPRFRMRTRIWDARRSLHDDGHAHRGQSLRVRALQLVHESARNCERALPIHFGSLQGPL